MDSKELRLTLERNDSAVLLRFETNTGKAQAVRGELDPAPKRCIGPFLREELLSHKRQKVSNEEERLQILRESQESALEGAQKASQVASLLADPWGEQQIRFLQLHPVTPQKLSHVEVAQSLEEITKSMPGRREEILAARNRLSMALPESFAKMEAAVSFLGHRWPLHSSPGHYVVELARPETIEHLMPRALVRVLNNPKKGVCLSFPSEISVHVQPRKELYISVCSQALGEGSSQSAASNLSEIEMARPQALHAALLEARRLLIDASIFEGLRKALSKADSKPQWTLRRVASNEIAFMAACLYVFNFDKPFWCLDVFHPYCFSCSNHVKKMFQTVRFVFEEVNGRLLDVFFQLR